ncbi:hypothetical protein M501DRAFT_961489, partial [Patellaria atrata CBS 101060]
MIKTLHLITVSSVLLYMDLGLISSAISLSLSFASRFMNLCSQSKDYPFFLAINS